MSARETFTWIGPFSADSSAGQVARGFAQGLCELGHATGCLDSGDGTLEATADPAGPVRWSGTNVVRQAPLSELCTTAAILPPEIVQAESQTKQVAFTVADVAALPDDARALLDRCDEVWAPSLVQLEILCALGVPRAKLCVVAPGIELGEGAGSRPQRRADQRARVLVVGGDVPGSDSRFERSTSRPGTRAFAHEVESSDLVVVLSDVDPWGRVALEALRRARPLVHVESGIAAEHAGDEDCAWLDPSCARDPLALVRRVEELLADRTGLQRRADRAQERIVHDDSLAAAAKRLVARRTEPRVLPEPRLARALSELGLPTPLERLSGSRADVLIVPVAGFDGTWRAHLRELVGKGRGRSPAARSATSLAATICLWVDEACQHDLERIAAAAESEIARSSASDHDVLVVVAPLGHAPRERFATSCV